MSVARELVRVFKQVKCPVVFDVKGSAVRLIRF
jgi:hypothetical protein